MPELLTELREVVASGALETRYRDPDALLRFLVETWLEAAAPDRAVVLMSRFEMDAHLAKHALTAVDQLLTKRDQTAALHACLLIARSGHQRRNVVLRAMKLDAARVLEELDAAAIAHGKEWGKTGWPAERGALLLAAGETKAAIAILDEVLGKESTVPEWMWPEFVERAPAESEPRLRATIRAANGKKKKRQLQMHLARALEGQDRKSEAVQMMRELIDAQFGSDEVASTFREIDRRAFTDWLAKRIRTKPCARSWGLYGDSLLATKQIRPAIAAWWKAVRFTPSCEASRRLLEHAPHQAIMPLTGLAQGHRDDELIGDIADALWQLGKRPRARDLWHQALSLDSTDREWIAKVRKVDNGLDPMR